MTDTTRRIITGLVVFLSVAAMVYLLAHWVLAPFAELSPSDESNIRGWSILVGVATGFISASVPD